MAALLFLLMSLSLKSWSGECFLTGLLTGQWAERAVDHSSETR